MPEGDTVWQTARRLHRALAGAALTHADLRVPRHATADLRGRTVVEVVARGKHLLIRIEPDLTVHSHLGMDGSWRVRPASGRVPGPGAHRVRAVLGNARWLAVGSELASLDLVRTVDEGSLVGHLGPDLLGTDWDADEAVRRLAASPDRPVVEALLDQRNLAGLGNVYAAELLFLRGVRPSTPVSEAGDVDRLVRLAREVLRANRDRTGHVTTGDRRPGRRHWVYGRAGEPCRRCGTQIDRGEAAGRVTYWCPRCQPARP
ncbi:MAG: DNA-formamidopyrimidine glycosylase family protein [Actinomycetota bacterium]